MRNENSYKENMKNSAMRKRKQVDRFMMEVYLQMVIDEAVFNLKEQKLRSAIDFALDNNDREGFYRLSNEYNQLLDHNRLAHSVHD